MPIRGALSGVRVLDFSEYIAGPYAGQMLADMGASVTKIEPLHGDFWRLTGPVAPNESRGFMGVNKGKRSASIDLKKPESREIVERAVRTTDVLLQNYRPGVAERLGLDYETLAVINPRLIYCENTAFGSSGPYRDRAGFDLASQAMTGIMSFEGAGDLPHPIITTSPTDLSAGMFMAFAVASALYQREHTGRGQRIETSLFAAGLAIQYRPIFSIESIDQPNRERLLADVAAARARGERIDVVVAAHRAREGAARILNPYYKVYETQDSYIALACLNNRLRRLATEVLGVDDPRVAGPEFDMNALAADDSLVLSELIAAIFTTKTTADWAELFDARGVPAAPVKLTAELFDDPQVVSQGLLVDLEHPVLGKVRMANSPLRMSEAETGSHDPSPALGQHTREFLAELGFGPGEIAAFERAEVVRAWNP